MAKTSFNNLELIPFGHYLVRPKILEGESIRGFVYRFYDANGLTVPNKIWLLIDNLSTIEMEAQSTHETLQRLLGTDVNLSEFDFFNQYLLLTFPKILKSNYLAQYRFCPACLNEESIHCSLWDLPMFTACPIHGCRLAYFCEQCKLPFNFRTLDVGWKCRCEYNFKESSTQPATELEILVSKVILNATDIPKTSIYLEYIDQDKFNKYTLNEFFHALKWASKFREIIRLFGNRKLSKLTPHSNCWSDVDSADYKFLLKRPTLGLTQKLLKKLSNQNKHFVSHLNGFSNFNVICTECTYLTAYDNPFTRHLIPNFQVFIKEYLNQLQHELMVYLNTPSLTISKPFSLLQFYEWWKQVMHLTEKFKEAPKNDETKIINFRGYLEEAIEAIFRHLIQASQLNSSELVYANLFKEWDFPETLKTHCGFENILVNLRSYLKNLHPYDLLVFHDLLNITDQSAQEKMSCLVF